MKKIQNLQNVQHSADIQERKAHHIDLAMQEGSQGTQDPFPFVELPYVALPEADLNMVDTSAKLLNKTLSQPLIIASMTGGTQHARTINQNLAEAAEQNKVAIGVGSQRVALEVDDAKKSFEIVRKYAPKTVVIANMGAVQLNYGRTVIDYQRVVDMIEADALYLHINPLQEAIQPEGDTNFSGLISKIEELVKVIKVPVFVKEVGHGLDIETARKLQAVGVSGFDTAGTGGTSWAWIEAQRAKGAGGEELADWFKGYGLSTAASLQQISQLGGNRVIIASGGLRSPIDGLKARVLGADFYSAASPFLKAALKGSSQVDMLLKTWQKGLKTAMFVSGFTNWENVASVN